MKLYRLSVFLPERQRKEITLPISEADCLALSYTTVPSSASLTTTFTGLFSSE